MQRKNKRNFPAMQPDESFPLEAPDMIPVQTEEKNPGTELKLAPGVSMFINIGNCQNQGARSYQEDAFGYSNIVSSDVVTQKGILAILSDGMGGLSDGKAVADYVVQSSISVFDSIDPSRPVKPQLETIVKQINDNVCMQYASDGRSSAGATIVMAYIYKNRVYWATAGDSRIYCLRSSHLLQLNEDHDYKNKLFREYLDGETELESVESDPQKDSLVSFIGKEGIPNIDCSIRGCKIKPGDIFVLCSDGIYNGISEETMRDILLSNDAQTASEQIVQNVLDAGFPGQDNMTVMVIKCSKAN